MTNQTNKMQSIDVYAATNPAFGALALHAFCSAFTSDGRQSKPSYPILFLVLPILFSRKGIATFDGTNVTTGFFEWLDRHPELKLGLAENIRSGIPYTKAALRFAIRHHLLCTDGYEYSPTSNAPWKQYKWSASDERGHFINCAKRLGSWVAKVPNETTVFHALGVHP